MSKLYNFVVLFKNGVEREYLSEATQDDIKTITTVISQVYSEGHLGVIKIGNSHINIAETVSFECREC
jgi:hypothetical protein